MMIRESHHIKGSELLKLTAFQLSTQSVGNLPSSPKEAAMPDTRHFYTQPLQLVTASVKKNKIPLLMKTIV